LKNLKCRRGAASAHLGFVLIVGVAFSAASCGGPYTPKKINVSGGKLAVADQLFAKGKYGDAALEYKDFLATFAGDERCDFAQFRLAESYRMDKEYALAEVEYRILISDYGYSEYVDDAFFLEGVCAFKQSPRVERDQTKSYEALDRLNRFVQLFPTSARLEEAKAMLREIHARLGEKEFLSARLYFSRKRYDAALIYLNKIIDFYPDTIWASRSRYYRGCIREFRRDWSEAAADYHEALSASGVFPEKIKAQKRLSLVEARGGGAKKGDGSSE
jgi:outer membrane protein assembly factor BamD